MIRGAILLICLLTSNYSYSQSGYPRRIVYNGDTIIAITVHQMQSINLAHVTWQECSTIQDSLLVILDSTKTAFSLYDTTISNLRNELSLYYQSLSDRDSVIVTQSLVITDKNKEIKKLKVQRTALIVFDIILIAVTVVILL